MCLTPGEAVGFLPKTWGGLYVYLRWGAASLLVLGYVNACAVPQMPLEKMGFVRAGLGK